MQDSAWKEQALLWHDDDLEGLEILHASYVTYSFAHHTHETLSWWLFGTLAYTRKLAMTSKLPSGSRM
jgi:hypothetical protein